jgi:hypothetical protein
MNLVTKGLVLAAGMMLWACAGGASTDNSPASGDEQDLKSGSSCAPIVTLTCQPGFESTEQGCAQSHVAGAQPLGRCVSVDAAKLTGTFVNPQDAEDDLTFFSFTFNADGTYSATGGCRGTGASGVATCHAIIQASGNWSIDKSGPQLGAPGGLPELVLVDSFKQKQTLFYSIDGSKLTLKTTVNGKASLFVKQ